VFSRYYRGSNVSGFVGTGVGLFLVAMVVRLHDGEVAVESSEGEGSRFSVTLASAELASPAPTGVNVSDRASPARP
jgi:signal transduction histidine kinase